MTFNFSDLQTTTSVSSNDQLLVRLDNSLSGSEGFSRVKFSDLENSFVFFSSGGSINGNVTIFGTLSTNLIQATSAIIDVVNITQYELSGFGILSGGLTVQGQISSNEIVYAQNGNSSMWNSVYSTVQSSSSVWTGGNSLSAIAWVDKNGNDTTGEIGNIKQPYLTMQSAFDDGARIFYIGAGTFSGITASSNIDISILGTGSDRTIISDIVASNTLTNVYNITVRDLGLGSASIQNITSIGQLSNDPLLNGSAGGQIVLHNVMAYIVECNGGNGYSGTIDFINGTNGGNGGNVTIKGDCYIFTDLQSAGGTGGNGYDDGVSIGVPGSGGNGGDITGDNLYSNTAITISGGSSGTSSSLIQVTGGTPGDITLRYLECSGPLTAVAGESSGSPLIGVSAGTINLKRGNISSIHIHPTNAGTEGTITGQFIYIGTIEAGSPTITAVVSYINGVPYGT